MSRKSPRPQSSRHVMIYDEDWEYLEALYGRASGPNAIGTGTAIKQLVHGWVKRLQAQATKEVDRKLEEIGQ